MLSIVFSSPSSGLSSTMGPRSSFEPSTASPFRAARRGDEVDGSKLERGPIVLDKPDGDEKTIDSID